MYIEKLFNRGWNVLVKIFISVSTFHLRRLSSTLGAGANYIVQVKESCVDMCQIYSHGDTSHSHHGWCSRQLPGSPTPDSAHGMGYSEAGQGP